jgi:hypothetical protein
VTPKIKYFKKIGRFSLCDVGINITLPQVTEFVVGRVKLVWPRLMEVRREFYLFHYLYELKIVKVALRQLA